MTQPAQNLRPDAQVPDQLRERTPSGLKTVSSGAGAAAGAPSPALVLQAELAARLNAAPDDEQRWSTRRTVLFIVTTCGAAWGLIGAGVALALR